MGDILFLQNKDSWMRCSRYRNHNKWYIKWYFIPVRNTPNRNHKIVTNIFSSKHFKSYQPCNPQMKKMFFTVAQTNTVQIENFWTETVWLETETELKTRKTCKLWNLFKKHWKVWNGCNFTLESNGYMSKKRKIIFICIICYWLHYIASNPRIQEEIYLNFFFVFSFRFYCFVWFLC